MFDPKLTELIAPLNQGIFNALKFYFKMQFKAR